MMPTVNAARHRATQGETAESFEEKAASKSSTVTMLATNNSAAFTGRSALDPHRLSYQSCHFAYVPTSSIVGKRVPDYAIGEGSS
jgi:hypothetical protein